MVVTSKFDIDTLMKRTDGACWICFLPVACPPRKNRRHNSSDKRASVDHVGDELKLAHAWCNSRRGSRVEPLTHLMRVACYQHMKASGKFTDISLADGMQKIRELERYAV